MTRIGRGMAPRRRGEQRSRRARYSCNFGRVDKESHSCLGPSRPRARSLAASWSRSCSMSGRIPGHILESLENRLQGDLILAGEFFGGERIRTMDGLVDHRHSDPSTLEE